MELAKDQKNTIAASRGPDDFFKVFFLITKRPSGKDVVDRRSLFF
jgi:hypothetical protein